MTYYLLHHLLCILILVPLVYLLKLLCISNERHLILFLLHYNKLNQQLLGPIKIISYKR